MSLSRGLAAMRLEKPAIIPHAQYITHPRWLEHLAGCPQDSPGFKAALDAKLDMDFYWNTDGPEVKGRQTNMGHAVWQEDLSDYDTHVVCPFPTPEDVLSFDPVAEYGLPDIDKKAAEYQAWWTKAQAETNGVLTGGLYHTVFSFAIAAFGWDMFLTAAGLDEERFENVLEGFFKIIMAHTQAWCKTDIEIFLTHDDIVWTQGAVFHPKWYRKHVFPRYKKYWDEVRNAGKKVLFCSDGNFTEFVDDIAAAGAQGFIFEPTTSLEYIVEKYGQTHVIIGNADTRILTFGTKADVYKEVKRCMDLGRNCPGFFFAVGNHIPPNVPIANADACLEAYWEMRER
jgi:hypothetical protein